MTSKETRSRARPMAFPRLGLLLGLAALLLAAGQAPARSQAVRTESAEFVVFLTDGRGGLQVLGSKIVPLVPNLACYGWRIRVLDIQGTVKMREVFTLPKEPDYWGGETDEFGTNRIVGDRRTSITERFEVLRDGWVANSWCVAEGDPEGRYTMEVFINDVFIERFDFLVREPDESSSR